MTRVRVFAAMAIVMIGCGGSDSNKTEGQLWQGSRSCQGNTDDLPHMEIPEASASGSIVVTETAAGLTFAEIDVGPIAGFSCSAKNVTVTFSGQVTGDVRSFDIGFDCVLATGDSVPIGGFGLYSKTALGLSFINFAAPVSFNGQTHAHLSCSFGSPAS